MHLKAKRVLVSVLTFIHDFLPMTYKTFFKLFDTQFSSVLYGSELWGLDTFQFIQQVYQYACKRFACATS